MAKTTAKKEIKPTKKKPKTPPIQPPMPAEGQSTRPTLLDEAAPRGPRIIVVGYKTALLPSARELMPEPPVPKSVTKEETRLRHIEEWWQNFDTNAGPFGKFTGSPSGIYAIEPGNPSLPIFDSEAWAGVNGEEGPKLTPALSFAIWLQSLVPNGWTSSLKRGEPKAIFIGFNLSPLFRMIGSDAAISGFPVPLQLWYGNDDCWDPMAMAVSGHDVKNQISLRKVMSLIRPGLSISAGYEPHMSPAYDAWLAFELAVGLHILPSDATAAMKEATLEAMKGQWNSIVAEPTPAEMRKEPEVETPAQELQTAAAE